MRTSWTARIGPTAVGLLPRIQTGPFADVVGRRGEAELRAGDRQPERRALVEVGQQLARARPAACRSRSSSSGTARRGSSVRAVTFPARVKPGAICSSGPVSDATRRAAVGRDRPDVEAAARERARRVGEEAPVAAPGGQRDDLVAARQPLQAAAVAPDHVEARGALAGILAHERDPAPVRRPVRIAVAAAARAAGVRRRRDRRPAPRRRRRRARPLPRPPCSRRRPRARAAAPARPRSGGVELGPPCRRMLPDAGGRHDGSAAELGRGLRERRDRADADVLAVEELEPVVERPLREDAGELGRERVLGVGDELALGELRPPDQLAEPRRRTSARARRRSGAARRRSRRSGSRRARP